MNVSSAPPTIEDLLDRAVDAINRQDHGTAKALAGQVLAVDRNNLDAEELLTASDEGCAVRRLTLLFVDLVDSTALSTRVDPEIYRKVIRRYRDEVQRAVDKFEGHIGSTQGDGLLAIFGHPTPHENDAHRAVWAGLEITAEVTALSAQLREKFGFDINVRIGVHRGVVTLDPGRDEVIGVGANLASRVCDLAEPGTVAVSEPVKRVLRGDFTLETRPAQPVKGFDQLVEYYRVVAEREDAPVSRGPLVGRHSELDYLQNCWQRAVTGTLSTPGVVYVGEGGIGKSRLADAAIMLAQESGAGVLGIYGSPFHSHIGLRPIRRLLERASGIARDSEPAESLTQLTAAVAKCGIDPERAVPLLAPVLGIASDERYQPPTANAGRLYDQIASTVKDYLIASMGSGPGLVVFEDIHWYDEDTLEIVQSVLAEAPGWLMVVVTGREVPSLARSRTFELKPLNGAHSELLVQALHPELDPEARKAVVERCDGMPLYIEEVIAKLKAQQSEAVEATQVPDTLYEALVARLSPNERSQQVIEVGALIGSQFDHRLLSAVVDTNSHTIDDILGELARNRVLKPFGNGAWRFRHELLREVAAELPPPSVRRMLHNRIGAALISSAADGTPEWPLVAHHFELGEQFEDAAAAYAKAADEARRRGALNESRTHLTRALDCASKLPPGTNARDQLEVGLRLERGFLVFAAAGHASVEAAADFERCLYLIDNHPGVAMYAALTALWSFFATRGNLRRAAQLVEALRTDRSEMPQWNRAVNEAVVGSLATFRGEFDTARITLEAAARTIEEMAPPEIDGEWYAPNDPVGGMYALLGLVRFVQGDLSAALESYEKMEKRCGELQFPHGPFTRCFGRIQQTLVHTEAGQYAHASQLAASIGEIATQNGLDEWAMISGSALANIGAKAILAGADPDLDVLNDRITDLRGVVAVWREYEMKSFLCWYEAALAIALLGAGRTAEARNVLDTALAMAEDTEWHILDAELLRLRAQTRASTAERDADLHAALTLARRQGALVFELRTAADIFRLHGDEYRHVLTEVLQRFSAGQNWPELASARALLA